MDRKWIIGLIMGATLVTGIAWLQLNKYFVYRNEMKMAIRVLSELQTVTEDSMTNEIRLKNMSEVNLLHESVLKMQPISGNGQIIKEDLLKLTDTEESILNHPFLGAIEAMFTLDGTIRNLSEHLYIETGERLKTGILDSK